MSNTKHGARREGLPAGAAQASDGPARRLPAVRTPAIQQERGRWVPCRGVSTYHPICPVRARGPSSKIPTGIAL